MIPRIGLADAGDPRVQAAATRLVKDGVATPVLYGGSPGSAPLGAEVGLAVEGTSALDQMAAAVRSGELIAGVAGSVSPSAEVIRAGIRVLGRGTLVSACFALGAPGRWRTYADCVVVPLPTAEQLAQIALDAAVHHEDMFGEPAKVAMLSFSTGGSASHPRVDLVREATAIVRAKRPSLPVDGEVQFDVAVDVQVAARKAPGSTVAGSANVLVFPSLEAANIAYKVAERVGGQHALGSFVLGLSHRWVDLSRGCSTEDIVETVRLLAVASSPVAGMSVA